ncbi:hypothetical protein [Sediminibacillus sp. JSM 1682029]|uniref:hypothetical protein n=1 Tax=Sediminibacillus sp. JSM 1682029 TaxID=3229857 RepID=UPI003525E4ED
MEVYLVIYCEDEVGAGAIKGLFDSEIRAKVYLADFAIKNTIDTSYLELVKRKVEVSK